MLPLNCDPRVFLVVSRAKLLFRWAVLGLVYLRGVVPHIIVVLPLPPFRSQRFCLGTQFSDQR